MMRTFPQTICCMSKDAPRECPSLWAELLLFLPIIRNTLLIRQRSDAANYTGIDVWALVDIAALGLCAITLFSHLNEIPWKKIQESCLRWWFLYYILCMFSVLWAFEGSSSSYILYRSFSMLLMSLYIFWIMSQYSTAERAFNAMVGYIWWIMFLGLLGNIRLGSLHTNSYSCSAAVIACMMLAINRFETITISRGKWWLITALICLVLGTSGGSNVAFLCGVIFLTSLNKKGISIVRVALLCLLAWICCEFLLSPMIKLLFPGKNLEGITSGTGRFKMWQMYWEAWEYRPWLGYGFAVGERAGAQLNYVYTLSAHNGFLSVLINTGLCGWFFFGIFLIKFIYGLFKAVTNEERYAIAVLTGVVVILINNNSVPVIGSIWGSLPTIALLLISFYTLFLQHNSKETVHNVV